MIEYTLRHVPETTTPFGDDFLERVLEATLKKIPFAGVDGRHFTLGAAAVTEARIQELNKEYRGKDKTTDVLSFGGEINYLALGAIPNSEEEVELGDLVYSPDFIKRAAEEDSVSEEHEMAYIFSHGILHLFGYDHEEEMFRIQDEVTEEIMGV